MRIFEFYEKVTENFVNKQKYSHIFLFDGADNCVNICYNNNVSNFSTSKAYTVCGAFMHYSPLLDNVRILYESISNLQTVFI